MENLLTTFLAFICEYAQEAHWILFGLLLLGGFSIPISEDLVLITGGTLAGSCIPEHNLKLWVWLYLGCWLSAWEAYWIGRILGPKLYEIKWFSRLLTPKRISRLHHYYEKFGVFTFIVGRFIPGGIRNALYMSSGLGKMPFYRFILRDGLACLISTSVLFSLGYFFGQNHKKIIHYLKAYDLIVFIGIGALTILGVLFFLYRRKKERNNHVNHS